MKEARMRTVRVLAALALAMAAGSAAAQPREIVFSGYGGDYGELMKKLVIEPFEKRLNAKVVYDATGSSAQKLAKLRASRDAYIYDVTVFTGYDLLAAGREGLMEPIAPTQVPNLPRLYDFAQREGQGWGPITSVDPLILLYNRDRVKPAPDSWAVLWDPRYKGKVAISHVSEGKGLYLPAGRRLHGRRRREADRRRLRQDPRAGAECGGLADPLAPVRPLLPA
jgi:putative spermidine/putrescine transport system substrate-binding protein